MTTEQEIDTNKPLDNEVSLAMNTLTKAINNDPAYAYGWHANIACMCADAMRAAGIDYVTAHAISNEGASRFMKLCFHVETTKDMEIK